MFVNFCQVRVISGSHVKLAFSTIAQHPRRSSHVWQLVLTSFVKTLCSDDFPSKFQRSYNCVNFMLCAVVTIFKVYFGTDAILEFLC